MNHLTAWIGFAIAIALSASCAVSAIRNVLKKEKTESDYKRYIEGEIHELHGYVIDLRERVTKLEERGPHV